VLYKKTAKEIARNIIISPYHFEKHARNHILNQFKYTFKDVKQGWYNYIYGHKSSVLGGNMGNPFISFGVAGDIGGWKQIGKTTVGPSTSGYIDVSSLANKRLLMFLSHTFIGPRFIEHRVQLNSDNSSNYRSRNQRNGGTDYVHAKNNSLIYDDLQSTDDRFQVGYISNYASKEKLIMMHNVEQNGAGSGSPPRRTESVSRWSNTLAAISSYNLFSSAPTVDKFGVGSEVVILGLDPADTHTDNFWGQLFAPVDLGANGTVGSGTFTAKKYIRLMGYIKPTGSVSIGINSNNDSSSNNASYRLNLGGATETTGVNDKQIQLTGSAVSSPIFFDSFIINVSSKEKLFINHVVNRGTAGAGYAPNRIESVGKYVPTSAITEFRIWDSNWNFITCGAGSQLAGWGSD